MIIIIKVQDLQKKKNADNKKIYSNPKFEKTALPEGVDEPKILQ